MMINSLFWVIFNKKKKNRPTADLLIKNKNNICWTSTYMKNKTTLLFNGFIAKGLHKNREGVLLENRNVVFAWKSSPGAAFSFITWLLWKKSPPVSPLNPLLLSICHLSRVCLSFQKKGSKAKITLAFPVQAQLLVANHSALCLWNGCHDHAVVQLILPSSTLSPLVIRQQMLWSRLRGTLEFQC